MTKESKHNQDMIMHYFEEPEYPFLTAKLAGERFGITSQSASGALRSLATQGKLGIVKTESGMSTLNIYYRI